MVPLVSSLAQYLQLLVVQMLKVRVSVPGSPVEMGVGVNREWKSVLALTTKSLMLGGLLRPVMRFLWWRYCVR